MPRLPAALLAAALLAGPAAAQDRDDAPGAEAPEPLNPWVLEVLREYPLDGTHAFHWPRSGTWEGTTRDVVYAGERLTRGDPEGRCYCCGLTFEVYVRALLRAHEGEPAPGVDAALLHELRLRFFGDSEAGERRRLVQFGLESLGLGRAVPHEEARAGDFVQFWRHSGSGHQAVFVNWIYRGGEVVGLTYWSTQGSTRGIGYRSEMIGPDGVKADEIYLARATRERAEDGAADGAGE